MTYAEYLAHEQTSEVKHEYRRGEVWPHSATPKHARLTAAVSAVIANRLRGTSFIPTHRLCESTRCPPPRRRDYSMTTIVSAAVIEVFSSHPPTRLVVRVSMLAINMKRPVGGIELHAVASRVAVPADDGAVQLAR